MGEQIPEVAYFYPAPYWAMREVDDLKTLLLFFDRLAILLPRYMRGREVAADPILSAPLQERDLLEVLEPEEFVDQQMTESLSGVMMELLARGAFDKLPQAGHFAELSMSRMGWDADVKLAGALTEELLKRRLAEPTHDGVSVPLHPAVRTTILVVLSQLARAGGARRGMDLHPVTSDHRTVTGVLETLSLPHMPSAGHVVALDVEAVALNLAAVPLDEILDFRKAHGPQYRAYARSVREITRTLSGLAADERERVLLDRRDELADQADELRRLARRSWRRPLASFGLGAVGAAWAGAHGDPVTAALALATGIVGAAASSPTACAYTYLFTAQQQLG